MNIIDYVKQNGNYSFKELKINEIDYAILASISYIDFDGILINIRNSRITIEEAANNYFHKYTKKELKKNIIGVTAAIKILDIIKDARRYKDLLLYNYSYKFDNTKQFSAIFIDIDEDNTYISFEGTDDLVSGWKEDFELSYKFPVEAHKDAIFYINKNIPIFSKRKYIIGGHSKGGNLALVASMYANPFIKSKITKVISFDGPGLKLKQMESKKFKSIQDRYELVIPNYSIVGLLLRHPDKYKVVKANKKGLMAHNILTWCIINKKFEKVELSTSSKKLDYVITNWLNNYNDQMREEFVEDLFNVLKRSGIESLLDIKATTLPIIFKESSKLDKNTKDMIYNLLSFIVKNVKLEFNIDIFK